MILKPKFPDIEAIEVLLDKQRFFMIEATAPKAFFAFESSPGPATLPQPMPLKLREPARPDPEPRAGKQKQKRREAELLAILKKKSMSSADLIEFTKLPAQNVYVALSTMRGKGLIHTVRDPETSENLNVVK